MNVPGGDPVQPGVRRPGLRFRPQVEMLEDRVVPNGAALALSLAAFPTTLLSSSSLQSTDHQGFGGASSTAVTAPPSQTSTSVPQTTAAVLTATSFPNGETAQRAPIVVTLPAPQTSAAHGSSAQTQVVTFGASAGPAADAQVADT